MGGQVRISTVGISRIHPPTPPPTASCQAHPPRARRQICSKSAQKKSPEKKPLRLVSRTSLFSPDPSQRGRTTQLRSPCAHYTGVAGHRVKAFRQEGFLYVGPGRRVQEPCPVPLIRPSKQRSPFPQGKLRMPVSLY